MRLLGMLLILARLQRRIIQGNRRKETLRKIGQQLQQQQQPNKTKSKQSKPKKNHGDNSEEDGPIESVK